MLACNLGSCSIQPYSCLQPQHVPMSAIMGADASNTKLVTSRHGVRDTQSHGVRD